MNIHLIIGSFCLLFAMAIAGQTYVIPVCDDDFHWRLISIDVTGESNSFISDAQYPTTTFGSTELGDMSIIMNGQFPQMFLTIQRQQTDMHYTPYLGNTTCTYVSTCFLEYSVIEVACTPVEWVTAPGDFETTGSEQQFFQGCPSSSNSNTVMYEMILGCWIAIFCLI